MQAIFDQIIFWIFAVIAVAPGLGILISRDIVRQAFWLLFSLSGFAGLYLYLGAGFLGFAQVVVYIGGILILFLFGVMLTHRMDVPLKKIRGWGLLIPGLMAGGLTLAVLVHVVLRTPSWQGAREGAVQPEYGVSHIGKLVMSDYILPFEVISVVLLIALVGATYIARRREERGGREK